MQTHTWPKAKQRTIQMRDAKVGMMFWAQGKVTAITLRHARRFDVEFEDGHTHAYDTKEKVLIEL